MLFLKQTHILPFLYHKSATTCQTGQVDSYKISNSKLKSGLNNCVKTETTEFTAPRQQPHKRSAIFCDTLYVADQSL